MTSAAPILTAVDLSWLRSHCADAIQVYLSMREGVHRYTRLRLSWAWFDAINLSYDRPGHWGWDACREARQELADYARQVAVERHELRMIRDILAAKEAA